MQALARDGLEERVCVCVFLRALFKVWNLVPWQWPGLGEPQNLLEISWPEWTRSQDTKSFHKRKATSQDTQLGPEAAEISISILLPIMWNWIPTKIKLNKIKQNRVGVRHLWLKTPRFCWKDKADFFFPFIFFFWWVLPGALGKRANVVGNIFVFFSDVFDSLCLGWEICRSWPTLCL